MSMKKPASLLAFVGALALVVTGPASVASPMLPGHLLSLIHILLPYPVEKALPAAALTVMPSSASFL